ncbi:Mss4-like protein [Hyaloscypha finlandica]|nr:Mss4-like protein [Hyaloscypha finlandica]
MTTSITSTCGCGSFNLKVDFPNDSVPLDRGLCLCSSCRRVTGSCGVSYIIVSSNQAIDITKFKLTSYETTDRLTRYFCSTCGAHVLVKVSRNQSWHLATGPWDRTEGIVNWIGSKWVDNTLDGGVSIWLKEIVGPDGKKKPMQRWLLQDWNGGELVPDHIPLNTLPEEKKFLTNPRKLEAQCHCGGVKFYITRPNEESKKAKSPFPDLMVPYHSHSPENPNNETWWLRDNDTKYLAGTCTCRSCRATSGFEIQPWAFIPKCNVFQKDGSPIDFNLGTMKSYESSKDIWREFCRVCGATIFWHCKERPELLDVSVGLLDPKEGARVESWLDWWTGRCSFSEDAVSTSLVAALERGLKQWGEERAAEG